MLTVRLSYAAALDIEEILSRSELAFGAEGRCRYEGLLDAALDVMTEMPELLRQREDLRNGLLSFHLSLARRKARARGHRVKDPRHVLICKFVTRDLVEIVRVLHDAMDLARHLPSDEEAG